MSTLKYADFTHDINTKEVIECLRLFNLPTPDYINKYYHYRRDLQVYLNNTDYINHEGLTQPRITKAKILAFHARKIKEQDDAFFTHFDKSQYKYDDKLDEYTRQNTRTRLAKQRTIEDHIQTAKDAIKKAIDLINEQQHPILQNKDRLIIPDAPLIKNKQNYYTPENQELYDYLDKHSSKFVSKHRDFLIINYPYDLDQAVEQLIVYEKYQPTNIKERKDNGEPIIKETNDNCGTNFCGNYSKNINLFIQIFYGKTIMYTTFFTNNTKQDVNEELRY